MTEFFSEDPQKSKKINLLRNASAAIFTALFALYIGITLTFQYSTYMELNKIKDNQTQKELEKRAISLNYFLVERKNDLNELISGRVLSSYYDNKALGMSLQYGLKLSLQNIKSDFRKLIENKRYENKKIYWRILLTDTDHNCIVDTYDDKKNDSYESDCNLSEISKATHELISRGNNFIFKSNIFYKDNYQGVVYAWIEKDFIKKNFLTNPTDPKLTDLLFSGKGELIAPSVDESNLGTIARENLHIFKEEISGHDFSGKKISIYKKGVFKFFGSKLRDSNYYLIQILPGELSNDQSPVFIISAMLILLAGAISGLLFWWRLNSMNFSLKTKVHQQVARKEAIKEKNKDLNKEVIKRRAAERTLFEYTKNLEKIIEQKTSHLEKALKRLKIAQSQLVQSEKMASIGQLSAGVAHEINNPLGFIKTNIASVKQYVEDLMILLGNYEELEDSSDLNEFKKLKEKVSATREEIDIDFIKKDFKNIFEETQEGIERILSIIMDLKFFAHKEQSEMTEIDIHQCINSTLNVIHNEVKYKARIIKEFSNIPRVMCYPQRINQILTNLIINAAQAIEKNGTITLKTYTEGDFVIVKIADTGSGIPDEIRDKIFDPFFSTKPVGKGTGLGLHVVYNLVKKHKGKIKIESTVGKGTSFYVFLPVKPLYEEIPKKLEN